LTPFFHLPNITPPLSKRIFSSTCPIQIPVILLLKVSQATIHYYNRILDLASFLPQIPPAGLGDQSGIVPASSFEESKGIPSEIKTLSPRGVFLPSNGVYLLSAAGSSDESLSL
jgi:hypothetical protein